MRHYFKKSINLPKTNFGGFQNECWQKLFNFEHFSFTPFKFF